MCESAWRSSSSRPKRHAFYLLAICLAYEIVGLSGVADSVPAFQTPTSATTHLIGHSSERRIVIPTHNGYGSRPPLPRPPLYTTVFPGSDRRISDTTCVPLLVWLESRQGCYKLMEAEMERVIFSPSIGTANNFVNNSREFTC